MSNNDEKIEGVSVAFRHAVELYRVMTKLAKVQTPADLLLYGYPVTEDNVEEKILVYTGFLVKMAEKKLGLSVAQTSRAMLVLNSMNCVTRIKVSGGGSPGTVILNYEPTLDQYNEWLETNIQHVRRTMPSKADTIVNQQREILIKMAELKESFLLLEQRLSELEGRESKLESSDGHDVRGSSPLPEM